MKNFRSLAALPILTICLAGWSAAAGVVVEAEQREAGGSEVVLQTAYYFEPGRLRVEMKTIDGDDLVLLYRSDRSVLWWIDRNAGTYSELTPNTVEQIKKRMEESRRQLAEQLAKLPPEQRQAMEEMLGAAPSEPATVTVAAQGEKVDDYTCTRYEVLEGGERRAEVWAAPPEQLKLQAGEFKTLDDMRRLSEPLAQSGPLGGLNLPAIAGFPVRVLRYDAGGMVLEERVVRAERKALDPKLFDLPRGLEKVDPLAEP